MRSSLGLCKLSLPSFTINTHSPTHMPLCGISILPYFPGLVFMSWIILTYWRKHTVDMISCLSPSWLRERTLSFTGGQALATHATPVRARNDRTILVVPLCIISPMVLVGLYMITSRPLSSGSCSLFSSLYFHNEMLNSSVVLLVLSVSLSLLSHFSFLLSYSTHPPHPIVVCWAPFIWGWQLWGSFRLS